MKMAAWRHQRKRQRKNGAKSNGVSMAKMAIEIMAYVAYLKTIMAIESGISEENGEKWQ
jgi:hypothetical protein